MNQQSLSELVNLSVQGDSEAFGVLVRRYAGMVTGVALSVCGDFSRSEDIGQEAFVDAWKNLRQLRSPEKFVSWICSIARHRAIDEVRRSHRRVSKQIPYEDLSGQQDRKAKTPEADMSGQQHRELVWAMLENLPPVFRETMVLYYRGEQSTREVAEALEVNEATVRQRLKRGREMLRVEMTDSIRETLLETSPQPAFAAAVIASLPAMGVAAGTATSTAAAGGASKLTGAVGAVSAGAVAGPLIGVLGATLGTWLSWRNCEYESQQRLLIKQVKTYLLFLLVGAVLGGLLLTLRLNGFLPGDRLYAILLIGLIVGFQLVSVFWMLRSIKQYRRLEKNEREQGTPMRDVMQRQHDRVKEQYAVTNRDGSIRYEAFQWNAGAWFGSLLGSSAWMVITTAILLSASDWEAGIVVGVCFVSAIMVTCVLWRLRDKMSAYQGIQLAMLALFVLTTICFVAFQWMASARMQNVLQWNGSRWFLLLLFPAIIWQFLRIRSQFDQRMQSADKSK